MEIKLYQFTKRVNSTKRPVDEQVANTVMEGNIANSTSLLAPTVTFDFTALKVGDAAYNPLVWTYAFIVPLKRYYFITNWYWSNGLYTAEFTIDTLATYKTDIYNQTLYVLRASARGNGSIIDKLYPTTARNTTTNISVPSPWASAITAYSGSFVVGTVSNDPNTTAGTNYYVMPLNSLRGMMSNVFNSTDWLGISASEISSALQKILFNPAQYIVSVMWYPFTISPTSEALTEVRLGWWSIPATPVYRLTGNLWTSGSIDISVPSHPQSTQRGVWLNLSPYSTYTLEFWPFGTMPLDSTRITSSILTLSYVIDYITGTAILRVTNKNGDDGIITSATGQIGVPIAMTHISYDVSQLTAANTILAGATTVLANNEITSNAAKAGKSIWEGIKRRLGGEQMGLSAGFVEAAPSLKAAADEIPAAIADTVGAVIGSPVTKGANGSTAQFGLAARVSATFLEVAAEDNEHNGRPLCEKVLLSTLAPGFVKTQTGDLEILAPTDEKTEIANFLTGGVYLE